MGKCSVFIPSHSHQAIPMLFPIPAQLEKYFPFPWDSHVTRGTHVKSRYRLISGLDWIARLVVKFSFSQSISFTAICPLLRLIWNLTTRCYDSYLHIGPSAGRHGLRCKKWDQQQLWVTLRNRNASSRSVTFQWVRLNLSKLVTQYCWSHLFSGHGVYKIYLLLSSQKVTNAADKAFGRVCLSVSGLFGLLTFERLGLETSFLICRCSLRISRSHSYIKVMMMMKMMKLPILPCAEKLELVLSTAPWSSDDHDTRIWPGYSEVFIFWRSRSREQTLDIHTRGRPTFDGNAILFFFILIQGSHASWKILESPLGYSFFYNFEDLEKVLKMSLVLESPGN